MLAKLRRAIQAVFGVSSREANGFIILLPSIFLLIFSQPIYRWAIVSDRDIHVTQTALLDSLIDLAESKKRKIDTLVLRPFDPNKATIGELQALGVSPFIAKRIEQYRSKGGQFRIKGDLKKIYGFDSILYDRLVPFIQLPDKFLENKSHTARVNEPIRIIEFDLNKADTSDFKSVRGIGSVLASRIVKYRERLGGFVSTIQLTEVYGLDSTVIQALHQFHVGKEFKPLLIAVNQATVEQLDQHPYLSSKHAKAIITYRVQHGPFRSADELKAIKQLPEIVWQKILPYLSFE